jgi:hypothetical protein
MSDRLDHIRARFAEQKIRERFNGLTHQGGTGSGNVPLKGYRTEVSGAIPTLRQCGLAQLLVFWASKAKNEASEEAAVFDDLLSWLSLAPTTQALAQASGTGQSARFALGLGNRQARIQALLQRSSREIALFEAEAEAIIGWLKRLVEGRYKSLPEKAP